MNGGSSRGRASPDSPGDDSAGTYWVRVGRREVELLPGDTLIGRGSECQVVVGEALVSRRHARIVLEGGRPYVEDLGSSNGTFLNQERLRGRAGLFPGDRLFVGTCELEIIRRADADRPTAPAPPREEVKKPGRAFEPVRPQVHASTTRMAAVRPSEPTTEVDGIEYAGRLAEKMFAMGRVDAAAKVLGPHLDELLSGVRTGRTPPFSVLDSAGRHAARLANETLDGHWVDVAIELHHHVGRPLPDDTRELIAAVRAKAPVGSEALFARYLERLRAAMSGMGPEDRRLCERVAAVLGGAARVRS